MIVGTPDEAVAKYVLQVTLTYRKGTMNRLGSFHVFTKAGWFGHADQLLKWCPHGTCTGLISDNFKLTPEQVKEIGEENLDDTSKWPVKYQHLYENWYSTPTICPKCGKVTGSIESLPDSYGFNLPDDRIAEKMAKMFYQLGGDCDIYLVRNKENMAHHKQKEHMFDPSTSRGQRQVRSMDSLDKLRKDREKVYYPLRTIISDTASGDVAKRFKALLGA